MTAAMIEPAKQGSRRYWGFCTRRDAIERYPVGFVLATSIAEARKKAKRRVRHYTARVFVWSDPTRATAPAVGHIYIERRRRRSIGA